MNNLISAMEETDAVQAKKVWESVKLYAVRCGLCSKWRLIPSKHKYEEIRAKLGEQMFECERAREWRPLISCRHESDVNQDDSNLRWAMDKPNIPQTPPTWQRILRIRAEGGTKFADVSVPPFFGLFEIDFIYLLLLLLYLFIGIMFLHQTRGYVLWLNSEGRSIFSLMCIIR